MSKYRIGIDCRLAGQRHAGIGRYTEELVRKVTAHTEIDWVLFYSDPEQIKDIFHSKNIPSNCTVVHAPVQHYTLKEQLAMNKIFSDAALDLLHVPHFNIPVLYSKPLVITIHDLLWHEYRGAEVTTLPAWKYWVKYGFYRYVTGEAVKKALHIFVPTQAVAKTLQKYFPKSSQKITVTPEGIGEELLTQAKAVSSHKRKQKQLLYVGSLYPHKNVLLILQALKKLSDYSVTIVSSRNVFREKLEKVVDELGLKKQVTLLSNVTDAELANLYQTSTALVQPSFSEGFGLTGLEAMAFATPVLASNIDVFHEVYKDAALFFDPHSSDELISVIEQLGNAEQQKKLAQAAQHIVKNNNWNDLADTTFDNYLQVLKKVHAH